MRSGEGARQGFPRAILPLAGRIGGAVLTLGLALLVMWQISALHQSEVSGLAFEVLNPTDPPADWRVVPLHDAHVFAAWRGVVAGNPVHPVSHCVRAARTRTDAQGHFTIQRWWRAPHWPPTGEARAFLHIEKAGYQRVFAQPSAATSRFLEPGIYLLRRVATLDANGALELVGEQFIERNDCPPLELLPV